MQSSSKITMQLLLIKLAKNNLEQREEAMSAVEDKYERGFQLIGGTAIEDRLQDEVRRNRLKKPRRLSS